MYHRLCIILFFCGSCCFNLLAQASSSEKIEAAEIAVQQALLMYSAQHKEYAYACLGLSQLYYQNINSHKTGDSLAYPALRFVRQKYGHQSTEYARAFRLIPYTIAVLIDALLALENLETPEQKQTLSYAQKLLNLSFAYAKNNDNQAYFNCLNAFRVLEKHPPATAQKIYDYAHQLIDPLVIRLTEQTISLDKALKDSIDPIELANKLLAVASMQLEYQNFPLVYTDAKISYRYFKRALKIYETTLGKASLKYQAAWHLMNEDMQNFYPIELDFWVLLQPYKKPSYTFEEKLKKFLRYHHNTYFVAYDNAYIFEQVFRYLENYHGGAKHRLFRTLQKIHRDWNYTDQEVRIAALQEQSNLAYLKEGANSAAYLLAKLELLNLQLETTNAPILLRQYLQLFNRIDELICLGKLKKPLNTWLQKVPAPWNSILQNETRLQNTQLQQDKYPDKYTEQLFKSAWFYLDGDLVISRGLELYKKALEKCTSKDIKTALYWTNLYLKKRPEDAIRTLKQVLIDQFDPKQLENMLQVPLLKLKNLYGTQSMEYAAAKELLADAYYKDSNSDPQKSLLIYHSVLALYQAKTGIYGPYTNLLANICSNIGIHQRWGNADSRYFFEALLNCLNRQQKVDHLSAPYFKKYADWLYKSKQLIKAEKLYRRYIEAIATSSQNGPSAEALYRIADILLRTNRLEASKDVFVECIQALELQDEPLLQYQCINGLGLYYSKINKPIKALELFKKALKILQQIAASDTGTNNDWTQKIARWQLETLRLIGRLYLVNGAPDLSQRYYQRIGQFIQQNERIDPKDFPLLQLDYARLASLYDDYDKAIYFTELALKKLEQKPRQLAATYQILAGFYERIETDSLANKYYLKMLQVDLDKLEYNYKNLAEQERFLYFAPIAKRLNQYYHFVVHHPTKDRVIKLFDSHIKTKGLALETTTNVQFVCQSTLNSQLKKECNTLAALRKKSSSVELDIDSLRILRLNIRRLERNITQTSTEIRESTENRKIEIDFGRLQKIISSNFKTPKTAAIDFILIEPLEGGNYPQDAYYYALLLHPDSAQPSLHKIASESALQEILNLEINRNGFNYISDKLESNYLYELVWAPLAPYLSNIDQVFICPSGQLNKIAFKTLFIDNWSSQRIMDVWTIRYVSSLQDLAEKPKGSHTEGPHLIALIGGVKFDAMYKSGVAVKRYTTTAFKPLPGTQREISEIGKLFNLPRYFVQQLSGRRASEENFYQLIDQAPSILHIASHGFFYENQTNQYKNFVSDNSQTRSQYEQKIIQLKDPLLRSGLALAGINRVWQGAAEIEGLENGILTALEVANLDLFNTKLVVLSACETGRGDIDNHEGIFGLKRAFKSAGAQQLLLSLWKVPDEQTQTLMLYFYRAYIQNIPAHKALEIAQNKLRIQYSNPYYWAAFQLNESVF